MSQSSFPAPPLPEEAIPERPPDIAVSEQKKKPSEAQDPPKADDETPQTLAQRLAKDEHFQSLSKAEKVKYYQEQLEKEQKEQESKEDAIQRANAAVLQHSLEQRQVAKQQLQRKPGSSDSARLNGGSGTTSNAAHKISKKQVQKYKKAQKERSEKKMRDWLLNDD